MRSAEIVDRFPGAHVLVMGDAMMDRYVFVQVKGLCPEAPVPDAVIVRTEDRRGGADNVAHQLEALGCTVYKSFGSATCVKTRYVDEQGRILLRTSHDTAALTQQVTATDIAGIEWYIKHSCPYLDVLVLSDYAKGWLTQPMCEAAIKAAQARGAKVIVDPKEPDWDKFYDCDLICPNEAEYAAFRKEHGAWLGPMIEKRADKGLRVWAAGTFQFYESAGAELPVQDWTDIPHTARRVYDVTGAGDTVVAVVAAAVAVGATHIEAAQLAAVAAGYVVGEVGTAVCPLDKLKELINAG